MLNPERAGQLMLVIAGLGLVAAVAGTIIGWALVADLDRGVGRSLELTGDVLVTVDESFAIADDALEILTVGVAEAEGAVRSLSISMEEGSAALETATELTGGEVADAIESVERSLPAMQGAAAAIDDTLAALDALPLGLNYDPDQPLAETIADMREQLRDLPDELREQAAQVETMSEELTAATQGTAATADSLAELDDRLAEASELIADYSVRTGEARALVDEQRDVLAGSTVRARAMIVVFGVVFALMQFVPFHIGMGLLGRPYTRPT